MPTENPLNSPQWISESTVGAAADPPNTSGSGSGSVSGSPEPPAKSLSLNVTPGILCCGVGESITATATATDPDLENPPVTVTCPDGTFPGNGTISHTYNVKDVDCGTIVPFSAGGVGLTKIAKVPVVKIVTQTRAYFPENRQRTLLGVSEDVTLTVTPQVGNCTWTITGLGKLTHTGFSAAFQADDIPSYALISASISTTAAETVVAKSITCSFTFSVIKPHGVEMENFPGKPEYHVGPPLVAVPSAGFCARVFILPNTVCFYNIKVIEDACTVWAENYWSNLNGSTHIRWKDFIFVAEWDATHPSCMGGIRGVDSVIISGKPEWVVGKGKVKAPLPWNYKSVVKSGAIERNFATVDNEVDTADDGETSNTKGGHSVVKTLNDPLEGNPWQCGG